VERQYIGDWGRAGQHDGEDVQFANAARDELRVLRAKIQDDDRLGSHPLVWQGASPDCKPNSGLNRRGYGEDFHIRELICKV
jgi:hypothetical protein